MFSTKNRHLFYFGKRYPSTFLIRQVNVDTRDFACGANFDVAEQQKWTWKINEQKTIEKNNDQAKYFVISSCNSNCLADFLIHLTFMQLCLFFGCLKLNSPDWKILGFSNLKFISISKSNESIEFFSQSCLITIQFFQKPRCDIARIKKLMTPFYTLLKITN